MGEFRVAEFKRVKSKQRFCGLNYKGFKVGCDGTLYKGKTKANVSDKRKTSFYEVNKSTKKRDLRGVEIYERDLVYDKKNNVSGVIKYLESKGAFVLLCRCGAITIPYSFLDCYEVSLEVVGLDYIEKEKNKWKR